MYYPNSPYCPENMCDCNQNNNNGGNTNLSKEELMRKIQEVKFAAYDLQLFLDTHPENTQALDLYTKLNATAKTLVADYENNYGPLKASSSPNSVPFMWVADDYKWPWVKKEEK